MDKQTRGWINGFIGILIFSGSLPATRIAVMGFDPVFLTSARASIAGLIAAIMLVAMHPRRPVFHDLLSLGIVSLGVVVGFPMLTAFALQHVSSAHSMIFIGLLPLSTAIFGVIRGGERPRPIFWLFSLFGSGLVVFYAFWQGVGTLVAGDAMMIAAIIVCGLGYAEGGRLSRHLGGWQVICWALVLSLPVMLPLSLFTWPQSLQHIDGTAWLGLAYVSLFSMLIGFIFWYRGLAEGGIASVGQLQLLQPFFGLGLAALLLGEQVSPAMLAVTLGVVACVAAARRFSR